VSLIEMAVVTGIVLRLYRLLVLSYGTSSFLSMGGTFALGMIVLLGMGTAHWANYPLHHWLWRVPAFAAVEATTETLVSALLIWAGREPLGTVRAEWNDLPAIASRLLLFRGLALVIWGLALAAVVHVVRTRFVREDEEEGLA
jgi:hypothetical protein